MAVNKEQALRYMIKLIGAGDKKIIAKTLEAFPEEISKSTAYNYLSELHKSGRIIKSGSEYSLKVEEFSFSYDNNGRLGEDQIFTRDIEPCLSGYEKNVFSAWRYAFTEMMNNAIEHSSASRISVRLYKSELETTVIIDDNGVGIFQNIKNYMLREKGEELSIKECATLLFTGKFTTARSMHSGEEIFFTSHLMDRFYIISDGVIFTRNNFSDSHIDQAELSSGTRVVMSLDNHTNKRIRDVFDRFSNVDEGFIKTNIPIAQVFSGSGPISRSEARRLGELINKFLEVELDFSGVEEVGQAFVHELFIVWRSRYPDISLTVLNASEEVEWMITRVKNTV